MIEKLKTIVVENQFTISTAESCTVGELVRLLTAVSGSSQYYIGGVVAYDYRQKIRLLGVKEGTIQAKTVVSKEVALEMVEGCQKLFETDIAIATTGVAGPCTDEFNNDIGLIYYAIKIKNKVYHYQMYFPQLEREEFVKTVSQKIIERLIKLLENEVFI
ncbi:MAG: hypothetical protein CSA38_04385 [Flavobacteriales bacterium]|nr:MAG: hypothetical protein CSA38_04385 [Flavobacteriales bacterium]